jgi:hypothetical protein
MTRILILTLLLSLNSLGQVTRSNYVLFFELQSKNTGKAYEYWLDTKTDTLKLNITQSNENFSGKHKLDNIAIETIFNTGINAIEKIKFDSKDETEKYCNYFVRLTINHNYQAKTIYIKDKLYFDQITEYLKIFNDNVPEKYRIPINEFTFDKKPPVEKTKLYKALSIDWEYNFFDNGHVKNKNIYYKDIDGDTLKIRYVTTKNQKNIQKDTLILPKPKIDSLVTKSLRLIHNYKFTKNLFSKENDDHEFFNVSYYTPGVEIEAIYGSFQLSKLNINSKDLIEYLNKEITPKHPFD